MATPKEHIEEIRRTKFSIGGEQNPLTEDLHQAVKNLSAELYAKDVHFLMELIPVCTLYVCLVVFEMRSALCVVCSDCFVMLFKILSVVLFLLLGCWDFWVFCFLYVYFVSWRWLTRDCSSKSTVYWLSEESITYLSFDSFIYGLRVSLLHSNFSYIFFFLKN